MSQVPTLSWICTFGSIVTLTRSLTESPVLSPLPPQWYGSPTCSTRRPATRNARSRSVTSTRASIAAREVMIVAQPPFSRPRSAASVGETSQNISGCSSERNGNVRLIPPAVWCSVSR